MMTAALRTLGVSRARGELDRRVRRGARTPRGVVFFPEGVERIRPAWAGSP